MCEHNFYPRSSAEFDLDRALKALINVSVAWAFFLAWVLYPPGIFGRFFVAAFSLPFLGLGEGLAFFFAGGGTIGAGATVRRTRLPRNGMAHGPL